MKIFSEEKAQGGTEALALLGVAVVVAITVGFYLKSFVTEEVQPEVEEKI
ncbi:MAG TPA: hypothetical protein VJG83_06075 [archaeon]|nr:hypothetical protein [archaeon]